MVGIAQEVFAGNCLQRGDDHRCIARGRQLVDDLQGQGEGVAQLATEELFERSATLRRQPAAHPGGPGRGQAELTGAVQHVGADQQVIARTHLPANFATESRWVAQLSPPFA